MGKYILHNNKESVVVVDSGDELQVSGYSSSTHWG